jgi:hypothetical protein
MESPQGVGTENNNHMLTGLISEFAILDLQAKAHMTRIFLLTNLHWFVVTYR